LIKSQKSGSLEDNLIDIILKEFLKANLDKQMKDLIISLLSIRSICKYD
jgi:hypothetical protein